MKGLLLVLTALAITLAAGCIGVETYSDEGQAIDTKVNQQFVIALGSNPTTGYSWQASYDETMLELVESTYKPGKEAKKGLVGAGGVEYFRFKALKAGTAEITLVYKQPWEGGGTGETKVFTVNIQ